MKFALSHTRALLLGIALIVVTNAVVLAGVAYNRSGEPDSTLQLTERELNLRNWTWPENENSSIDLHLHWRIAQAESDEDEGYDEGYGVWYRGISWLEPAQLRELGFEVDGDIESEQGAERIRRQPSRRAWVVLEYEGPAYQASVARAREKLERATALENANPGDREFQTRLNIARDAVQREENDATRLFVVDVGHDEAALRARFPNRQRYAVVHGRINVMIAGQPGRQRLIGQLAEMDVSVIRVPHRYRTVVEPYVRSRDYSDNRLPPFVATVNFGRRFEPWIVDLALK